MGWLIPILKAAAASIVPQIAKDLWDRYKPKAKTEEPPVTVPEEVEEADPPAADSPAPGSPSVAGGSAPDESEAVEVNIRNDPNSGQYLIEEDTMSESGVGRVVGPGWVKRAWPPAGGGSYHYITRTTDDKHGYAQWTPLIREEGEYDVFVRYAESPNRTTAAIYVCKVDGKTVSVKISQRGGTGTTMKWKKLGRWPFAKGKSGFIRLLNSQGHSESADSLALRKVK